MENSLILRLCQSCFGWMPTHIARCTVGIGNYVYRLEQGKERFSLRCSKDAGAYTDTVHWLNKLNAADVPVPQVLWQGCFEGWQVLLLTWLEGQDLGIVYPSLTWEQKRQIARDVEVIQQKTASISAPVPSDWRWQREVDYLLDRADDRIRQNGYFDPEKVSRLRDAGLTLTSYFEQVSPTPYLDDITSKNLLIRDGEISGVIDVDWIGLGDRLTQIALTRMSLLNLQYDNEYVTFLLEEFALNSIQRKAFQFYTLLYCVDFMGERGTQFLDKRVPVSPEIVARLNGLYDMLWQEWLEM